MKNFVRSSLLALMLLSGLPEMQAAAIGIAPTPVNVTVGQSFTLDFLGTDFVDLYTYQFDLLFDPLQLQANLVSEGSFLLPGGSTFFIPGTIDNNAGVISFTLNTLIGPIPGVTGSGSLATIEFQALAAGSSQVSVDPNTILLLDSNGNDLEISSFESGTINVSEQSSGEIPEPSGLLLLGSGLLGLAAWKNYRA